MSTTRPPGCEGRDEPAAPPWIAFIHSLSEGVVVADACGRVLAANAAALPLLGFDTLHDLRARLVARPAPLEPGDLQGAALTADQWLPGALRPDAPAEFVVRIACRRSGVQRLAHCSTTSVPDEAGTHAFTVLTLRDVTAPHEGVGECTTDLRQVLDSLCALAGILTPEGRFVEVNRAALSVAGLKAEDVLGQRIEETYWLRGLPSAQQARAAVDSAARGETVQLEAEIRGADDRLLAVDARLVPLCDFDGNVRSLVVSAFDITERKRAEQALAESEHRFRTLADAAPVMIWTGDERGAATYVSKGWTDFTGRPMEQHLGYGWREYMHPDDLSAFERFNEHAIAEPQAFRFAFRVRRADGTYRWVQNHGVPRFAADGTFLGYVGSCADVHDLEQARIELAQTEDRLRLALSHSPVAVFEQDRELRYTWASATLLAPDAPQVLIGKSDRDILSPEDAEVLEAIKRSALESGVPQRGEVSIFWDGNTRHLDLTVEPLRDQDGTVTGIMGIAVDVTDRAHLENRLRRQARQLERADRRKDEFLAMLGHELRNPLAPIQSAADLLRMQMRSDDAALLSAVDIIRRQVLHLRRLVDDLLDAARITSGHIRFKMEPVVLQEIVALSVEGVRPSTEAKRHTLTVEYPDEPIRLVADPVRIGQVIGNLLSNASKYTQAGGHIAIECRRDDREAVLTVRDDGAGISPDLLPNVFELFVRDVAQSTTTGGLGIGLTLARQVVEGHHGSICARSEGTGRGSEFTVRLPLAPVPAAEPATDSHPDRGPKRRVLVVDDNQDAANSLAALLRAYGHEVKVAFSGPCALETAHTWSPDVVFLDIGMPEMDGYEVARRLRAGHPDHDMLLVALTGFGRPTEGTPVVDRHLLKPASLESVVDAVESYKRSALGS
jgi:PAS domain S-box-containing protein